jgi:hypothetical protein
VASSPTITDARLLFANFYSQKDRKTLILLAQFYSSANQMHLPAHGAKNGDA